MMTWSEGRYSKARTTQYGTAVDIYSLGIIMWEIFAREEPFKDVKQTWDIVEGVQSGVLRPVLPEAWPKRVQTIIQWCWFSDPRGRPTAGEVHSWIEDPMFLAMTNLHIYENSDGNEVSGSADATDAAVGDVNTPHEADTGERSLDGGDEALRKEDGPAETATRTDETEDPQTILQRVRSRAEEIAVNDTERKRERERERKEKKRERERERERDVCGK